MSETSTRPTSTEPVSDPVTSGVGEVLANGTTESQARLSTSAAHHSNEFDPPRAATVRSEIRKYLVSILILGLGVGVGYGLYLLKEAPKEQDSKELIPMVAVTPAMSYVGELDKVISGTVVPYREIKVAAEISGTVVKKYEAFDAGNFVKKGTKLIEIDPADYKLQLKTGEAELNQAKKMKEETVEEIAGAKRNIQLAQDELRLAQSEHNRNTRIQKALSTTEYDQSKRSLLAAQSALTGRQNTLEMLNARINRLEASIQLSAAQLNRTKLNLDKTTIVAPDDGVIVREMVQEGDFVRAGDQLVMFEDTSRSEVICNLTPSDLAWVRSNSTASSEFENEPTQSYSAYQIPKTKVAVFEIDSPGIVWEGMLERFDGIGRDQSTRSIPCRITIEQPVVNTELGQRALVRGMYVKCRIQVQTSANNDKRKFMSFPAVALRPGNVVWTVSDHKLKRHEVDVVDYGERLIDKDMVKIVVVAVREGSVQPGDEVVMSPLAQPSDGAEVILESEFKKAEAEKEAKKKAEAAGEEAEEEATAKSAPE